MDENGGESWGDAFRRYGANFGWWFLCFSITLYILNAFFGLTIFTEAVAVAVGLIVAPKLPWRQRD